MHSGIQRDWQTHRSSSSVPIHTQTPTPFIYSTKKSSLRLSTRRRQSALNGTDDGQARTAAVRPRIAACSSTPSEKRCQSAPHTVLSHASSLSYSTTTRAVPLSPYARSSAMEHSGLRQVCLPPSSPCTEAEAAGARSKVARASFPFTFQAECARGRCRTNLSLRPSRVQEAFQHSGSMFHHEGQRCADENALSDVPIVPGQGKSVVVVPLAERNLKMLRPDPVEPVLAELRAKKTATWVRQAARHVGAGATHGDQAPGSGIDLKPEQCISSADNPLPAVNRSAVPRKVESLRPCRDSTKQQLRQHMSVGTHKNVVVVDPTRIDEEGRALHRKQTMSVLGRVEPPFALKNDDRHDRRNSVSPCSEQESGSARAVWSPNTSSHSCDDGIADEATPFLETASSAHDEVSGAAKRNTSTGEGVSLLQRSVLAASERQLTMLHLQPSTFDLLALQQQTLIDGRLPQTSPQTEEASLSSKPANYYCGNATRRRSSRRSRSVSIVFNDGVGAGPVYPPPDGDVSLLDRSSTSENIPSAGGSTSNPTPVETGSVAFGECENTACTSMGQRDWNGEFQSLLDRTVARETITDFMSATGRLQQLMDEFHSQAVAFVEQSLISTLVPKVSVMDMGITYTLQSIHVPDDDEARHIIASTHSDSGREDEASGEELSQTLRRRRSMRRSTLVGFMGGEGEQGKTAAVATAAVSHIDVDDDEDEEDELKAALADALATEIDCQRKIVSNELQALNALTKCWWECTLACDDPKAFRGKALLELRSHGKRSSTHKSDRPSSAPESPRSRSVESNQSGPHHAAARRVVFPLACVVHHLGHVVMCTATLPPDIVVDDRLMHEDHHVHRFVGCLADRLGLAAYWTADDPFVGESKLIAATQSLRFGSSQSEGRVYLVAAPGLLPPVLPTLGFSGWLRMRAEFTSNYETQLCSDAFSPKYDFATKTEHNINIMRASRRVTHKNITDIFDRFTNSSEVLSGAELCRVLHERGINIGFLGCFGEALSNRVRCFTTTTEPDPKRGVIEKYFAVVKEEMCVRAFRHHLNKHLRAKSTRVGACREELLQMTTNLVRCFFGPEDDSKMHALWVKHIAPQVRSKFKYPNIVGRKDVCIRTALVRLEELCGIRIGEFDPAHEPRSGIAMKDNLLKLMLRSHRACLVGEAFELRPRVKRMDMPFLPSISEALSSRSTPPALAAHISALHSWAVACCGPRHGLSLHLLERCAEALQLAGDCYFSSSEAMLLHSLRLQLEHTVPLEASASVTQRHLAALYHVEHRTVDAIHQLQQAVLNEVRTCGFLSPGLISPLRLLGWCGKDGGRRDVSIVALERCLLVLHAQRESERRGAIGTLVEGSRPPIGALAVAAEASPVYSYYTSTVGLLQHTSEEVMDELSVVYGMLPLESFPAFDPTTCSQQFMQILHEAGIRQLRRFNALGSYCVFQRVYQLAKLLHAAPPPVRASERIADDVLHRCAENARKVAEAVGTA